jgi:hypothetical protein
MVSNKDATPTIQNNLLTYKNINIKLSTEFESRVDRTPQSRAKIIMNF